MKIIFDPSGKLKSLSTEVVSKLSKTTFDSNSEVIYLGSESTYEYLKSTFNTKVISFVYWDKKSNLDELSMLIAKAYEDIKSKPLQTIFVEVELNFMNY